MGKFVNISERLMQESKFHVSECLSTFQRDHCDQRHRKFSCRKFHQDLWVPMLTTPLWDKLDWLKRMEFSAGNRLYSKSASSRRRSRWNSRGIAARRTQSQGSPTGGWKSDQVSWMKIWDIVHRFQLEMRRDHDRHISGRWDLPRAGTNKIWQNGR